MARKQDAGDIGRRVDLGPMTSIEDVKDTMSSIGPHVLGDADMQVRVVLSPDQQEWSFGAPEFQQASRIGSDLVGQLIGHLGKGGTSAWPLSEVVVDDWPEEIRVSGLLCLGQAHQI